MGKLKREYIWNSQNLWDAKIKKKYMPKKNNHTQDSIYVVRQFAYVHGVAGISLLSGKITECGSTFFSLLKTYWPKPLLHRLSHRKSPIKNYNSIISGRVIIRIKHN